MHLQYTSMKPTHKKKYINYLTSNIYLFPHFSRHLNLIKILSITFEITLKKCSRFVVRIFIGPYKITVFYIFNNRL